MKNTIYQRIELEVEKAKEYLNDNGYSIATIDEHYEYYLLGRLYSKFDEFIDYIKSVVDNDKKREAKCRDSKSLQDIGSNSIKNEVE